MMMSGASASGVAPPPPVVQDRWVACDTCQKWRRVTDENADISGDQWFCHMNVWDPAHNTCEAEEENSDEPDPAELQQQQQQYQQQQAFQQQMQQRGPSNPFAAVASSATNARGKGAGAGGGKRRKKKRDSDDESADQSGGSSDDEAFYASLGDGAGRRSTREKKPAQGAVDEGYMHPDFAVEDESDGGAKKRKAASKTALPWTPDADDALLNAIVKHGLGNWTRMVNDPEFAARLEGHKANQLRTRWKKLGSAEFGTGAGGSHEHPQQKMEVKKEKPFEQITAPVPMQQQQAPEQQQQHPSQSPQQPRAPVVVNPLHLIPPVPPFVSYRHYPTHVFDEPKSSEEAKRTVKAALGGTVADAQLSTPMDLLPQKPKKRGRKAKNAQSSDEDFSSEDSSGSEGGGPRHSKAAAAAAAAAAAEATVLGGVKNEFRDLEANLDNLAYMNYYDHRDDSLQLYETYAVPMRDLKKQFVWQYGMKNQDALELMKALTDAPDLYTRRNMLAKAIHAHVTSFQSAQLVRQWITAVRSMTNHHLHKTHDLKLRMEQEKMLLGAGAEGQKVPGYVRGPYKKGGNAAAAAAQGQQAPAASSVAAASAASLKGEAGKTPGLLALDKLAYYWRKKLADAKASNGPFPGIKGATPAKALLQLQLTEIEKEWHTPAMTAACLRIGASHPPQEKDKKRSAAPPTKESIALAAAAAVNLEAQDKVLKQLDEIRAHETQKLQQIQAMQAQMSPQQFEEAKRTLQGHTAAKIAQLEQQLSMLKTQAAAAASAAAAAAAAAAESDDDEAHAGGDSGDDSDTSSVYDLPLPNITLTKLGGGRYKIKPPRVFAHLVPVGAAPEVVAASLAATGARVPGFGGVAPASAAKASKKRSRKSSGAPAAAAAGGSGETDDDGASSVSASVTGSGRHSASSRRGPTIRLRKAGAGRFKLVAPHSQQHDDMAD